MDRSNGYEEVAAEFLAGRGGPQSARIGAETVREWARRLAHGTEVLELGAGSGIPITEVLIEERLSVWAIDAAPSFVAAFQRRFPGVPVANEAVEDSAFFGRTFDAALAWGLVFLLEKRAQELLIAKLGAALKPGGRLLFTAPPEVIQWNDAMTGHESRSLGAETYRYLLAKARITVLDEYEDEGENHYYDGIKAGG